MKFFFASIIALIALPFLSHSQEQQPVLERKNYFQIFLTDPVQKVNKVTYFDDSGPVEFKLSPDGKAIYLLDYKGEGGVKAEVVDLEGNVQEITKSKCNIHSLPEL